MELKIELGEELDGPVDLPATHWAEVGHASFSSIGKSNGAFPDRHPAENLLSSTHVPDAKAIMPRLTLATPAPFLCICACRRRRWRDTSPEMSCVPMIIHELRAYHH
jgi:hypothetical protein